MFTIGCDSCRLLMRDFYSWPSILCYVLHHPNHPRPRHLRGEGIDEISHGNDVRDCRGRLRGWFCSGPLWREPLARNHFEICWAAQKVFECWGELVALLEQRSPAKDVQPEPCTG